jgi:exodeoxyribonuclease VII small subunit
MAKKDKGTFEDDLKRLEEIVRSLDSGDLPLDDAIALYEEGVALAKRCGKKLDDAEAKVEMILRRGDKLERQDL